MGSPFPILRLENDLTSLNTLRRGREQ